MLFFIPEHLGRYSGLSHNNFLLRTGLVLQISQCWFLSVMAPLLLSIDAAIGRRFTVLRICIC